MGKVYVGELGFDSLKEAQEYAAELKKDPNYVAPVKAEKTTTITHVDGQEIVPVTIPVVPLEPDEGSTNDGFVPAMGMDEAAPGQDKTVETVVEATQDKEDTQTSDAASSVTSEPESNTVVVDTGLEFETKELTEEEIFEQELAKEEADQLASNPTLKEVHGQD